MQINHGVEWSVHALVLLAGLPEGKAMCGARIAEFHGVPRDYMAKQLQALSRAGLVTTVRGRSGGYRLSRPATQIDLRQVLEVIEGKSPAFRCQNIRENGPCPTPKDLCKTPCPVAKAMWEAERVYRDALAATSIADLAVSVAQQTSPERLGEIFNWMMKP